jgi:hypothetical protein
MTITGYKTLILVHLLDETFPAMVPNKTKHITTDEDETNRSSIPAEGNGSTHQVDIIITIYSSMKVTGP